MSGQPAEKDAPWPWEDLAGLFHAYLRSEAHVHRPAFDAVLLTVRMREAGWHVIPPGMTDA